MEISIDKLKEFALKRLHEEKEKDKNEYWCLNNKTGYGMHYWDCIESALDPIFEDLKYALEHPEILEDKDPERGVNDYNSVRDSIDNIYKYYGGYINKITIIAGENIDHYEFDPLVIKQDMSVEIADKLFMQGCGNNIIDAIMDSSSYNIIFFEDHNTLSILIHV